MTGMQDTPMTATLGTIYYIAPEVIKGYLECDGFEWSVVCDVFSCLRMWIFL